MEIEAANDTKLVGMLFIGAVSFIAWLNALFDYHVFNSLDAERRYRDEIGLRIVVYQAFLIQRFEHRPFEHVCVAVLGPKKQVLHQSALVDTRIK